MRWSKRYLLVLILVVQSIALLSTDPHEQIPYFPIEISRTAATTALNRWVFPLGVLLLVPVALRVDGPRTRSPMRFTVAWLGLFMLAWFDDKHYWLLHMIGVGLMILSLLSACGKWNGGSLGMELLWQNERLIGGLVLYAVRVVLKVAVVVLFEAQSLTAPALLLAKVQAIALHGASATQGPFTLSVFRLCGVVQWLAFWLFASAVE